MAEWKKVIVSGSNISQLNNDAGYLTSVTAQPTFATMSINGINVIADSSTDTLTFASSSGAGLNIVGDSSTDSITFTLGSIPNSSLANSAVTVTAGNGLTGGGSISLGSSATVDVGAGTHITVNANDIAVNTTTLTPAIWAASASYTGSIFTQVSGDITISATGVAAIGTGVIVNADVAAAAAIAASKINFASTGIVSGSSIASGAQGEVTLTTNGVAGSTVDLGLQTTDSPSFAGATLSGNLAINNGTSTAITTTGTTAAVFNATATTLNIGGAATAVNIGASTGTTTVNNNLSVIGNMYVQGSVTAISSSNLYVADQFILLASGSTTNTDGGIVIDRGSYAGLNIAYGFDSTTGRWGYQAGVTDTTNTLDPTGISGSYAAYVFTEASHGATKPTTGEFAKEGASYISTAGDIWIYA